MEKLNMFDKKHEQSKFDFNLKLIKEEDINNFLKYLAKLSILKYNRKDVASDVIDALENLCEDKDFIKDLDEYKLSIYDYFYEDVDNDFMIIDKILHNIHTRYPKFRDMCNMIFSLVDCKEIRLYLYTTEYDDSKYESEVKNNLKELFDNNPYMGCGLTFAHNHEERAMGFTKEQVFIVWDYINIDYAEYVVNMVKKVYPDAYFDDYFGHYKEYFEDWNESRFKS